MVLNRRPRKMFGWRTRSEAFNELLLSHLYPPACWIAVVDAPRRTGSVAIPRCQEGPECYIGPPAGAGGFEGVVAK